MISIYQTFHREPEGNNRSDSRCSASADCHVHLGAVRLVHLALAERHLDPVSRLYEGSPAYAPDPHDHLWRHLVQ